MLPKIQEAVLTAFHKKDGRVANPAFSPSTNFSPSHHAQLASTVPWTIRRNPPNRPKHRTQQEQPAHRSHSRTSKSNQRPSRSRESRSSICPSALRLVPNLPKSPQTMTRVWTSLMEPSAGDEAAAQSTQRLVRGVAKPAYTTLERPSFTKAVKATVAVSGVCWSLMSS